MALKENYKDDILDTSQNTKRKYRMTENPDGTVSFDDETEYLQEGDNFGASDLNAMAHAINNTSSDAEHTSYDNTESGLISDNVQDAIDEVVEEFEQTPITIGGETLSTIDDKLNYIIGRKGTFINKEKYEKRSSFNYINNTTERVLIVIEVTTNGTYTVTNHAYTELWGFNIQQGFKSWVLYTYLEPNEQITVSVSETSWSGIGYAIFN